MNSVEIPLFYDDLRLNAIKKYYEGTVESYLEYYLDILYDEIVPQNEQEQIRQTTENIRAQEEAEAKENDRYSLNHIRENNRDYYFIDRQAKDLFLSSRLYRQYTNGRFKNRLDKFRDIYNKAETISKGMYFSLLKGYCDNANITSVLEFDLDSGFANSKENNQMQWASYRLKDLSTAVYFADLKKYAKADERINEFQNRIAKNKIRDIVHFYSASLLTADWKWESYDDGSGCLENSDGKEYFGYDISTQEYRDLKNEWDFMYDYPSCTPFNKFKSNMECLLVKEGIAQFNSTVLSISELEEKLGVNENERTVKYNWDFKWTVYDRMDELKDALSELYSQRDCKNSFNLNTVGKLTEFYSANAICNMLTESNKEIYVYGIEFERDYGNDIPQKMYKVYTEITSEQAQADTEAQQMQM